LEIAWGRKPTAAIPASAASSAGTAAPGSSSRQRQEDSEYPQHPIVPGDAESPFQNLEVIHLFLHFWLKVAGSKVASYFLAAFCIDRFTAKICIF
jgi:hypothetical protein